MTDKASRISSVLTDATSSLFDRISCPSGSYCEPFSSAATLRPHWQLLIQAFEARGKAMLESDHERGKRMRHEDGATINPFDDLTEQTTAWALDIIPFPISAQEWSGIEGGLKQRAGLLEKILADTYGPQELLKQRKIDAEFYFSNPNFLHSCHGIRPAGDRYLTFYAADLYRDPQGQFRVLRDYGANPAGLGYALENRIVISRLFSELYHKNQIRRLAPFFHAYHQALIQRAALSKDDPGIVLFSPGPDSDLYFEHALLSRYLGYPLVEGQDLTVRNGKVFLKKIAGLEPVEAIFRQIDDHSSDPFALKQKAIGGVAGLIQACRAQNIEVVNPVGSGFVDTPALKTLLPHLCREMLGEDLLLPNHPGWWCGNSQGLNHVVNNLSKLRICSAMDQNGVCEKTPDILEAITSFPARYMASSPILPSQAPAWGSGGVTGCYNVLRVFVCATQKGYAVMPGGLAITSTDKKTLATGLPKQQQSKDIWVLSDEPVELFTMMDGLTTIPAFKRSSDLPNRVADNLLWLGRYLERAEGMIRLLRAIYQRLSGEDRPEDIPELQFLLTILQAKQVISLPTVTDGSKKISFTGLFQQLRNALYRKESTESVINLLQRVQQTTRNVRDRLSVDTTRVINRLEDFKDSPEHDPLETLDQTLFTLSAFSGLAMESMTRGMGWAFMDMGRRVERAMNQAALIRVSLPLVCANSRNTLQALLEVSESLMTYRGRYRSSFQLAPVLDLLLSDESNPKSVAFQFSQLATHVETLPRQDERRFSSKEERIALEMLTEVRLLDLTGIRCGENNPSMQYLSVFLTKMESQLKEFAQEVTIHYLTRVPATPHYSILSSDRSV
ncbi:circularly permuted type 2 ATP-grasp protein [Desulfogranum marinum]|uniref:circularly permuted type 2 ATP-grasp protein n=1 Tax=Desulfogranum marinum TaxID=453220 RepID=UPI0029C92665|nr:circularly permuted type 2 ATP-grasp protein [Desulfogranum marinum]